MTRHNKSRVSTSSTRTVFVIVAVNDPSLLPGPGLDGTTGPLLFGFAKGKPKLPADGCHLTAH